MVKCVIKSTQNAGKVKFKIFPLGGGGGGHPPRLPLKSWRLCCLLGLGAPLNLQQASPYNLASMHFVETQARFQQACEPFLLTEQY